MEKTYAAFAGDRLLASGAIETVLAKSKRRFDKDRNASLLIFDNVTGRQIDFDFSGTPEAVLARLSRHPVFASAPSESAAPQRAGPGRPKLGVVCREVSLLPRHWDWLEEQPQGISGSLRRLVEEAAKREPDKQRARKTREAAGRFMWAMAGNLAGFEEASRALYAGDAERLRTHTRAWPRDIRAQMDRMLAG